MKRVIKIMAAVLSALVLTVGLSACGSAKSPEAAVEGVFDALKEQNLIKAAQYVDLTGMEDLISDKSKVEDAQAFLKEIGKKLDYEIVSCEQVDENTARVKTNITSIDMAQVMKEYISQGMQYSLSSVLGSSKPTEEENKEYMEKLFMQCLAKEGIGTVTNEVDITVEKADGKWKVNADDTFNDAVLGGISNTAKSILTGFGEALLGSFETQS